MVLARPPAPTGRAARHASTRKEVPTAYGSRGTTPRPKRKGAFGWQLASVRAAPARRRLGCIAYLPADPVDPCASHGKCSRACRCRHDTISRIHDTTNQRGGVATNAVGPGTARRPGHELVQPGLAACDLRCEGFGPWEEDVFCACLRPLAPSFLGACTIPFPSPFAVVAVVVLAPFPSAPDWPRPRTRSCSNIKRDAPSRAGVSAESNAAANHRGVNAVLTCCTARPNDQPNLRRFDR